MSNRSTSARMSLSSARIWNLDPVLTEKETPLQTPNHQDWGLMWVFEVEKSCLQFLHICVWGGKAHLNSIYFFMYIFVMQTLNIFTVYISFFLDMQT